MAASETSGGGAVDPGPFQPNWESLKQYRCPEWFRDAKFGIFMHWGPCSVPAGANDGWYGRQMYLQKGAPWGKAYEFHVKTYGHPSEVGYKDLIPLWKAEHWNPAELIALYKQAGARYIVPVAAHHDNFDCYRSSYQPWNSVAMGPKRDIIGEWRSATLNAGLRFGVSSHSDRAWGWFEPCRRSDLEGPLKGVQYDGRLTKADGKGKWWEGYDPQDLYGPPMKPGGWGKQDKTVSEAYEEKWLKRTTELIDQYGPDLIYFDGGMPMGERGLKVAAHFYNRRMDQGKTKGVLNIKWNPPRESIVDDLEKGLSEGIRPYPWQVDASINNMWFADELPLEMTADQIVHTLVDAVSKNGNLLLNVALNADGTLSKEQRERLIATGQWLAVNGEAIYGTRPAHLPGEGPTVIKNWQAVDHTLPPFTPQDVRFTIKADTLYAIFMGCPKAVGTIASLRKGAGIFSGAVSSVQLLGWGGSLRWTQDESGLHVPMPARPFSAMGVVLKITGLTGLERDGVVRPRANGTIKLLAWDAQLTGAHLSIRDSEGAITHWNNSADFPKWDFICPEAGSYDLNVRYAAASDGAEAVVESSFGHADWKIAGTRSDQTYRTVNLGQITVAKPGRHTLAIKPLTNHWKPIDLAFVELKNPTIRPEGDGLLRLPATDAVLHGKKFFLQGQGGRPNIGGWNSSEEWVSWDRVEIRNPGKYEVSVEASAANGPTAFQIAVAGSSLDANLEATASWDEWENLVAGVVTVDKPGLYSVALHPDRFKTWNPMNFGSIALRPVMPVSKALQ